MFGTLSGVIYEVGAEYPGLLPVERMRQVNRVSRSYSAAGCGCSVPMNIPSASWPLESDLVPLRGGEMECVCVLSPCGCI